MTQPTAINLLPNEYIHGLGYYPLEVNLDRCSTSCNTFTDLLIRAYVPNNTSDLNLSVFYMITGMN